MQRHIFVTEKFTGSPVNAKLLGLSVYLVVNLPECTSLIVSSITTYACPIILFHIIQTVGIPASTELDYTIRTIKPRIYREIQENLSATVFRFIPRN